MTQAVFAIPGDKDRKTGGFIYEATVLRVLNEIGCKTAHLQLPDSFPDPTPGDMDRAISLLQSVPHKQPIILDGLVYGAIDPERLATIQAPIIAMIHHPLGLETGLDKARSTFLLANEAAALAHADRVIVPSPHTAAILAADFGVKPDRITIALPGFHRPNVDPKPMDPPCILSIGLLAERKGHDVLLDALAQLTDLRWQAEIVGKAHDEKIAIALQAQAETLGLQSRVTFVGELDDAGVTDRFNAASIFALATRYEGYGMVLSEAMLFGLPVVSCRVGAVPDTVGGAGLLVPANDPTAFAQALRELLESAETVAHFQRMSRQRAKGLPTWTDTARVFERVIGELGEI